MTVKVVKYTEETKKIFSPKYILYWPKHDAPIGIDEDSYGNLIGFTAATKLKEVYFFDSANEADKYASRFSIRFSREDILETRLVEFKIK